MASAWKYKRHCSETNPELGYIAHMIKRKPKAQTTCWIGTLFPQWVNHAPATNLLSTLYPRGSILSRQYTSQLFQVYSHEHELWKIWRSEAPIPLKIQVRNREWLRDCWQSIDWFLLAHMPLPRQPIIRDLCLQSCNRDLCQNLLPLEGEPWPSLTGYAHLMGCRISKALMDDIRANVWDNLQK